MLREKSKKAIARKQLTLGNCKRGKKRQQKTPEEADHTHCMFCSEEYGISPANGWIQCTTCQSWAHDLCAGVESDDDDCICDLYVVRMGCL